MTKELVTRLRDDFDKELGDEGEIETYEFAWRGVVYESELRTSNVEIYDAALAPLIEVARRQPNRVIADKKKSHKKRPAEAEVVEAPKVSAPRARIRRTRARISNHDMASIRKDYIQGMTAAQVAEKWDVSTSQIYTWASTNHWGKQKRAREEAR